MRILLLSRRYAPEPSIKTPILARELSKLGHEIEVVTTFPNYPLGRIYDGYKQSLHAMEQHDGVRVHRVPFFPDHSQSALRRIVSYVSFGLSARLIGRRVVDKPDLIWAYHPPLPTLWTAVAMSKRFKVPLVVEIQDMWPETLAATSMASSPRLLRAVDRSAKKVYTRADAIAVISPGFKRNLIEKGVPPDKIHVIPNWADSAKYPRTTPDPDVGAQEGMIGTFDIVFAGTFGKAQQLEVLIRAAAQLSDLPDFRMTLIGSGVEDHHLRTLAETVGASNVRFLGRRPESEMSQLLAHADGLIVHLKDDPLFSITIPSKILTYLAAGKPIIAAVRGDAAQVITDADAGIRVEPGNIDAIAAAMRQLYNAGETARDQMGSNARTCFEERFTPEVLVPRYVELFESLVKES